MPSEFSGSSNGNLTKSLSGRGKQRGPYGQAHWRDYPAPEQLANIGTKWIKSKSSLLLDIPSAVVDKEVNTLINPLHPDIKHVNLKKVEK